MGSQIAFFFRLLCVALAAALAGCGGGGPAALRGDGSEIAGADRARPAPSGHPLAALELATGGEQRVQAASVLEPGAFFDWAERQFPALFPGPRPDVATGGFVFRYYPATDVYLAVIAERVYALGPVLTAGQVIDLGPLSAFAGAVAASALPITPVRIAAGTDYSLALRADGTVLAWGRMFGGPGVAVPGTAATKVAGLSRIRAVAASTYLSAAIDEDGTLWACGYERFGLLSGRTASGFVVPDPVKLSAAGSVAEVTLCDTQMYMLRRDGQVWMAPGATSANAFQLQAVAGLAGVVHFAELAGTRTWNDCRHLAIKGDGTVWKLVYQGSVFAAGTTQHNVSVVQVTGLPPIRQASCVAGLVGNEHCLALAKDGTVWAWGNNDFGQLGVGDRIGRTLPVRVQGLSGVAKVSVSAGNSLALTSGGGMYAWGLAVQGAAPDETRPNWAFNEASQLLDLSPGGFHALALKSDGTVWGWGENGYGQLGDGTLAARQLFFGGGPTQAVGINLN